MATFNDITSRIKDALERFNKKIPASQRAMLDGMEEQVARLELNNGRIKPTVANLKIVASIKNKLLKLVLNEDYLSEVREFAQAFRDVSALQREYWQTIEANFKPRSILKEIRTQAISDTVSKLTESGIGTNIADNIADILRTNITTGGSYKDLLGQLRESLTDTQRSDGLLTRYSKQITTDSLNQYSANYTQMVSSDLGYQWFAYQGSDIKTTRPWCDSMTDRRYFHVSELPKLLRADDLYYVKDGKMLKVPIYPKTGLPHGMIDGTDVANIFIRRGGYNCGHQIRPVSASLVKAQNLALFNQIINSPEYKAWTESNPIPGKPSEPLVTPSEVVNNKPQNDIGPIKEPAITVNPKIKDYEAVIEPPKRSDVDILMSAGRDERFLFSVQNNAEKTANLQKEFPKLNQNDVAALDIYGDTFYRRVNNYLRNKSFESAYDDAFVRVLTGALDKLPDFKGTVYRGGNFDKSLIEQYRKAFNSGKDIVEVAFTSTSEVPGAAFEGNTFFIIQSKSGKSVTKILDYGVQGGPMEFEVLFKPGTRFSIEDISTESGQGGRTVIKMKEI